MTLLPCETEEDGKDGLATKSMLCRLKGSWKPGRPQWETAQATGTQLGISRSLSWQSRQETEGQANKLAGLSTVPFC